MGKPSSQDKNKRFKYICSKLDRITKSWRNSSRNHPRNSKNFNIPKIIFRSWKTEEIPEHWQKGWDSFGEIMSGWHQVLMTDYDNGMIMKTYFPEFYQQYIDLPYPIERADVARVACVVKWGGIYADLDYECLHNLDDLFKISSETYLLRSGNIAATITNSFFAGKPGSKFLTEYLNSMFDVLPWWRKMGKHLRVMNQTGPIRLSECGKKTVETYVSLPSQRLFGCNLCEIKSINGGPIKPKMWLRPLKG